MRLGIEAGRAPPGAGTDRSPAAAGWLQLRGRHPAELLLAAAVIGSATVLVVLGSRLTFLFDDWAFLIYRRGWSAHTLLRPHNEHIVVMPVLIYKTLLGVFGMESALPFRVVAILVFLTSAVLLFAYLRRRLDVWLAFAGATIILFLGAAFEDLLWPFQIGFFGSVAAGLGMLLALERRDHNGDRLACAMLTVSIAFSSLGLSFLAGAAVDVALSRERWRSRVYVAAVPALLYAAWWLGWGHTGGNAVSWTNLGLLFTFVANAVATALSSLLGLSTPAPENLGADWTQVALDWGRPLLVVALGLTAWRIYKLGRIPPGFWVVAAVGFSFWLLAGLNAIPGRSATASRYVYVSAVFVLLIAAELLRGVRLRRPGILAILVAVPAIVASNLKLLDDGYRNFRAVGEIEQSGLGVLDITRGVVDPGFVLSQDTAPDLSFSLADAGSYFAAADDFGSPAFTPSEIVATSEQARVNADQVLAAALHLRLRPEQGAPPSSGPVPLLKGPPNTLLGRSAGCITVEASRRNAPLLQVPEGGVVLQSERGGEATVRLRRFAQQSIPVDLGKLQSGATVRLAIPADRANVPWRLSLQGSGPVRICGLG